MRVALAVTLVLFAQLASSQDLTGIWRGSFTSSNRIAKLMNQEDRYKYEVQLDQRNKSFKGVTYSYKTTVFYGKASANGTINPKTGKVLLQEIKMVEVKMQFGSDACLQVFMLQYSKNGNEEFLEGKYTSFREKDSSLCDRGTVSLRKVTTSDFHKEPFLVQRENEKLKKKAPLSPSPKIAAAPPVKSPVTKPPTKAPVTPPSTKDPMVKNTPTRPLNNQKLPEIAGSDIDKKEVPPIKRPTPVIVPRDLSTRENEVLKTITVNSTDVLVNIYDNGTIDHDTVSVYLDKKLVISKQMLTTTPITLKLNFDDDNSYHELVMVAENLGDIPPNTSLMVVKSGDKVYEVRITSTEQKNGVIEFRYERPK